MLSTVLTTAQEVLNGSFETNSFFPPPWHEYACNYNNNCNGYHQKMAHSNAWETVAVGNQDCFIGAIKEGCYYSDQDPWGPPPQHGEWSVLISGSHLQSSWGSYGHRANAISLALSSPLEVGRSYALSYYIRERPQYPNHPGTYYSTTLSVGISEKDTSFGEYIHTSVMPDSVWRWQSVIFEATIPAQHLTFKINTPSPQTDVLLHYSVLLDNVSISTNLELAEQAMEGLSVYPNPTTGYVRIEGGGVELLVHDFLGRERYRAPMNGRHSLFIHDWPQGIYMLKTLNSQGQHLATQKLIKIK